MFKEMKQQNTTEFNDSVKLIDNDIEEPKPTSVKDLKRIAKKRGIKYSTAMTKKDLCMVLGMELSKPIKYLFKNAETGEEHRFHSIYQASKDLRINPGLIHYYLRKEMTIDETTYTLSKVQQESS